MASRRQVAALIKGTTIDGALRLAAKRHESAESINLTWTEYQALTGTDAPTQSPNPTVNSPANRL